MVSVGRSVRSYVCADLLSTREGSPLKEGRICTPLFYRAREVTIYIRKYYARPLFAAIAYARSAFTRRSTNAVHSSFYGQRWQRS